MNQLTNWTRKSQVKTADSPGITFFKETIDIEGTLVDRGSALYWAGTETAGNPNHPLRFLLERTTE